MVKRKHDPGYKLPEVIAPDENCCICIPIPNDFNHKMAFLGQLDELGYWWNWERDELKQGREAAAVWRDIVACIREELNMSGCGCGDNDRIPTNQRYTEDGHLEVSYDNGVTWENADATDPRFNSPVFAPLPGADGSTKRCKGANSVVAILKDEQAKSSAILDAATGLTALITAVAGYVASTGVGIVVGVVIALMSAILTAIINAGETTFTASFGGTTWDDLLCILYCEMEDDGTFTVAGWESVVTQAGDLANYPANEWLAHMIKVIGPVGLTNASLTGVAGSMSCAGCECDEEWCYEFNFLTDDYDFVATFGTWTLGQGWVGTTAGTGKSIFLRKAHAMTTFTHVEIDVVYNPRGNLNFDIGATNAITQGNVLSGTYSWDGSITDDDIMLNPSSGVSQGNSVRLTRMLMRGTGTNPFSETDNCI
jgi:hypothetical protein